jgi:GAF domain-containing protein
MISVESPAYRDCFEMPDDTPEDPGRIISELRRERDEAVAREAAIAELLRVINSSPGDLAPVFDSILDKAHSLCGATLGALILYDDEHLGAAATRGFPQEYIGLLRQRVPARLIPAFQRLLRGERIVHVADLAAVKREGPDDNPITRAAVEIAGMRTALFVPLRKEGRLLGYFSAARKEVREFSDKEIALLENFAAQAVIAMENARLITETREALEQQTATADVLGVINSSPGNLAPVFDTMLDKAMRLCEAACGVICSFDGKLFYPGAARGNPRYMEYMRRRGPWDATAGFTFGRVVTGEPVVHITDVTDTPAFYESLDLQQMTNVAQVRSLLTVALQKDNTLIGTISVFREEPRPFTDKQIALLQNFAAQAVIAMENARLITETREALEQQTATAEVLQVINSSPGNLAPVFDAVLEKAMRLCEASFGLLTRIEGETFSGVASHGAPPEFAEFMRQPQQIVPGQAHHRLLQGTDVVHTEDITTEDVYREGNPARRALVDLAGARTGLCVALRKDDAVLGAIIIYRKEVRPFTDKQVALLQNFAAQAVIAMENARLITETREALEQQTATAEVLGVINSSPGDLTPVFDAILDKARTLCGAAHGSLSLYDGERFRPVAINTPSQEFAQRLRDGFSQSDSPLVRRLLDGNRLVHVGDLAEIDHPGARAAVELTGAAHRSFRPAPQR